MKALISNPPYNMKWEPPVFAQLQPRFCRAEVPPSSNANFAFILTALEKSDRSVFILPNIVLDGGTREEAEIRKYLIDSNYVETVILCPDKMFESTSIATCLLVLNKAKSTATIEMIDMREKYNEEEREQKGQFGGSSHTNRTYKKTVKVFTSEIIEDAMQKIKERESIPGYCKNVSLEEVKNNGYSLKPSQYIEFNTREFKHREYKMIVDDINRIVSEKNACKLTINETIAKNLGFDLELYKKEQDTTEFDGILEKISGEKLLKHDYFKSSKNKNEIKFENNSKELLSSVLTMVLNIWKQHIYYLNTEENRYLAELRDALIEDLMSGKVRIMEDGRKES